MILTVCLNASYLSEFGGKSRVGGHYFLTNNKHTFNNCPVLALFTIIKHLVGWAAEVKLATLFYNCKQTVSLQVTLAKMGHAQPKMVVTTDNSLAHGLITRTISPKAAKSMDMHFNWCQCWQAQNQFIYQWQFSDDKLANYHTKHYPCIMVDGAALNCIICAQKIAPPKVRTWLTCVFFASSLPWVMTCEGVLNSPSC